MEKRMQTAEYICYQYQFPWDITRKREVLLWRELLKKRWAWNYRVLWLKEVTFLYLQLANAREARSAMMCKTKTDPYWLYKHCQQMQKKPSHAYCGLTLRRNTHKLPRREAESSHLPGHSQQPMREKMCLSRTEVKEDLYPSISEVKHFGVSLLETQLFLSFRSIIYYRVCQTQGGLSLFVIGVFGVSQLQPVMVSWLEPVWDDRSLAGVFAAPTYLDPEEAVPNGRDLVLLYWLAPVQQILHPLNKISLLCEATKAGLPSH